MADKEKVVKKELIGIKLDIFPEFTGARVSRDVKIGDGTHKFTVGIPIPKNDEEAKSLYGMTIAKLIEKGAKQLSYDRDTDIGNMVKEAIKNNVDFGMLSDASPYTKTFQSELSTPKERKTSEITAVKNKLATAGVSASDMDDETIAIIAKAVAEKKAKEAKTKK